MAYFGLVISVGRDTAEPLADACMLGGLLAYRHRRSVLAALLLAYGVVTNEPILVLASRSRVPADVRCLAPGRVRMASPPAASARAPPDADLAWLLPGAAYLVLQDIEHWWCRGRRAASRTPRRTSRCRSRLWCAAVYRDVHG